MKSYLPPSHALAMTRPSMKPPAQPPAADVMAGVVLAIAPVIGLAGLDGIKEARNGVDSIGAR